MAKIVRRPTYLFVFCFLVNVGVCGFVVCRFCKEDVLKNVTLAINIIGYWPLL